MVVRYNMTEQGVSLILISLNVFSVFKRSEKVRKLVKDMIMNWTPCNVQVF